MTPEELRRAIEARGVSVLAVGGHPRDLDLLIVYLPGNCGQWVGGAARRKIAAIRGVITAVDSVQTPSIILVRTVNQPPGDQERTSP
jgi:hypothetical protein